MNNHDYILFNLPHYELTVQNKQNDVQIIKKDLIELQKIDKKYSWVYEFVGRIEYK